MKQNIILISGKAGHGKTTFANLLEKELIAKDRSVLRIAFADYLKYICTKYYGWDGVKNESGRKILQHIGTDVVRARDNNFWADIVSRLVNALDEEYDYYIIDDVRFPNEIESFPLENTLHVRLNRYTVEGKNYLCRRYVNPLMTEEERTHSSETALDDYAPDISITNFDDRLGLLQESAELLAEELTND